MKGYKYYKTIMGRKYYIKMSTEELKERRLLHWGMFLVPTVSMLMLFTAAGFFR